MDEKITALSQLVTEKVATPEVNLQHSAGLIKDSLVCLVKASTKFAVLYALMEKQVEQILTVHCIPQEGSPSGLPVVRKSGKEAHERRPLKIVQLMRSSIQRTPRTAIISLGQEQFEIALEMIDDPTTAHSFAKLVKQDRLQWVRTRLATVDAALRLVKTCEAELSEANRYEYLATKELIQDYGMAQAFVEVERKYRITWLKWKLSLASSSS
ncbi:hypothetical protein AC1031_009229 [Aphanomyces cochlioides]|nr:hypothetical protein AC1031_009229 [Aphanomyces cochlioides]